MKKPPILFGIRGGEVSSMYQTILREIGARAAVYDVAVARGWPLREAGARALEFFELFIMGRAEEARAILIRLGSKRFGEPDDDTEARVAALSNIDRLEDLIDRVFEVASWDGLLAVESKEPN
jgi:hypothetical protein